MDIQHLWLEYLKLSATEVNNNSKLINNKLGIMVFYKM